MGIEQEPQAALAPQYAFVVQFAADSQIAEGRIYGRVEHVVSRQARHFTSFDTLLAFMAQVLQGVAVREQETRAAMLPAPPDSNVAPETGPPVEGALHNISPCSQAAEESGGSPRNET